MAKPTSQHRTTDKSVRAILLILPATLVVGSIFMVIGGPGMSLILALFLAFLLSTVIVAWTEGTVLRIVEAKRRYRAKVASIVARAETQNAAFLRGDPRGVYGDFPPPTGYGISLDDYR